MLCDIRIYLLDKIRFRCCRRIIHRQVIPDNGFEEGLEIRVLPHIGKCDTYNRILLCDRHYLHKNCRRQISLPPRVNNLHSAHGLTVVLLPFGTVVLRGAVLYGAVVNDIGQPSSQICRVSSQTTKIRLGIMEIQNSFFEVFFIRSCSCKMALPNFSLTLPACFSREVFAR